MKKRIPPLVVIVLSFALIILIGMLLLKLPFAVNDGQYLRWVDSLFLATSAVCVTGLVPIPNIGETLSVFGKIILCLLVQIGGLGFVTIGVFVLTIIGAKIGLSERYLIKEALNQNKATELIKLVKSIVFTTLIIEAIGCVFNFMVFIQDFDFFKALGISIFHSVSSFNNAGFDILGSTSLITYSDNVLLNITTTSLIILGGIGFVVIRDVIEYRSFTKLSIHSKIVIKMTIGLIITGTLFLKLSEGDNITWLQAYFQSVTARTAGFSTISYASVHSSTILIMILLMFIGASPCSTGGGIKTTTFYTMIKSITSFAKGKKTIVYNRKISEETKLKAFTLTVLAFMSALAVTLIILMLEKNNSLGITVENMLFETVSAIATVGLSVGITPILCPLSKILLCFLMFLGRLGPLTIIGLWKKNWAITVTEDQLDYIEEKIIIG